MLDLLLLLVYPDLESPDGFPFGRKLDMGVRCVHFAACGMAHQRHANFLQDASLHQAGVEGVPEIVKTDVADARMFECGSPRALHELDLLAVVAEYGALAPPVLRDPPKQPGCQRNLAGFAFGSL